MQVSRAAAARTHSQLSRQMRFGACSKGGSLLVSHMDPAQVSALADGIRNAVERVAGNSVDAGCSRTSQYIHEQFSYILGHRLHPLSQSVFWKQAVSSKTSDRS